MRSALFFALAAPVRPQTVGLRVVHFNDVHARVEPVTHGGAPCSSPERVGCFGGFAKLAHVLKTESDGAEEAGSASLLLDAGDYFQGSVWDTFYQGEEIWQLYNLMNLDAVSIGNHEFDHGSSGFANFVGNVTAPVISCNIDFSADSNYEQLTGKLHTSLVVDKTAGATPIKVGIVAYTLKATESLSRPGPDIVFSDELEVVPQCLKDVEAAGADVIILIGHSGIDTDAEMAEIIVADDTIPKPILFVGAHTHTPMGSMEGAAEENPYPKDLSGLQYVQAYFATVYAGAVDLEVDIASKTATISDSRIYRIAADPNDENFVEDDTDVAAKIDDMAALLEDFRNTKVGETTVPLPADESIVLYQEALLGNMLTDAMAEYVNEMTDLSTEYGAIQIAMMNGGSIKYSMEGDIIMEDVLSCMPYGNQLAFLRITGANLTAALENGFSLWSKDGELEARFPQVSGMEVTWDGEATSGARVTELKLKVGDEFVEAESDVSYNLVCNDYIAGGGEGYDALANAELISDTVVMDADAVLWYLEKHITITPKLEGRLTNVVFGGAAHYLALLWLATLIPFF